jgi:hypothetical protein
MRLFVGRSEGGGGGHALRGVGGVMF